MPNCVPSSPLTRLARRNHTAMIIALWIAFALLLLCWSGLIWAVHAVLHLPTGWAAEVKPWLDQWPGAEWLERWSPGWRETAVLAAELLQSLASALTAALPWLSLALWLAWGVVALLLLAFFGLLHLAIRSSVSPGTAPGRPLQA